MSKQRYVFILSRDWRMTFGDILTLGDSTEHGEFRYRTSHTEKNPRLNWSLYYDAEGRAYLVMHMVDTRGDTMHWNALPMRVTRAQIDRLDDVDGHDINILFLGTRRMSRKMALAATLSIHRTAITGVRNQAEDVIKKASEHRAYMQGMSVYFEQYMSPESSAVDVMDAIVPYPVVAWEY